MPGRPSLGLAAVTLALAFPLALAGCDSDEGPEVVTAQSFEQGVAKDSDGGAFRVVLTSPEPLEVGENSLVIRLGFHDPADPLDPGRGIPGADVQLDAWMPLGNHAVDGLRGVYIDDGEYLITGLDLAEPGVWQLDFAMAVGENVDDSVSFAFVIGSQLDDAASD